ncbi:Acetyl esterase/lipase [Chitinophaga terrae (ex Kim and Jung 2007)]|uniref:Acetyl esterase/lipase n=1 Tax=Chitinophaga terrae (ex Kim and Jung 2007) TaxID=408074 RepID=A0A1H4F2J8_9BACT|nr:alpha/beta hydrolase [Chitinophaga terrae (ex Kim and Jung 2007)]MDQ0106436.1 acetyl esterase/lipase [Chitinophaga terrae (ex Kim and Jung 2007)]GEP92076.1 xylanase [Chitinophaga terrae (ex Kim and Jung 2007)]SEA91197.1 Acetyl esterase/lipase [Chitinophaga terrae (ex Kim and Jung 2007)]
MKQLSILLFMLGMNAAANAQQKTTIHLWPQAVPGESASKHAAVQTPDTSNNIVRLTDVTDPILEVFPAPAGKNNGKAVIINPGGGYSILAINHEGYDVAAWLNQLGYNAFVLQYRVPKKEAGALQDAQRAIRIVRSRAAEWKINPDKIGMLGFSAGGSLAARASTLYNTQTYSPVDKLDSASARPDFAVLIYPAYLDNGPNNTLTPELKVDAQTPPTFLFGTADDYFGNSVLVMAAALRKAKVNVEQHLYPSGGHGYGLRANNVAGKTWPALLEKWLISLGY